MTRPVLDITFPPERLNDTAGDPYWIDLTRDEARRLHARLAAYFAEDGTGAATPLTFDIR